MKEIDVNLFFENYDENLKILKETREVWILVHEGQRDLVIMHKDTYEKEFDAHLYK